MSTRNTARSLRTRSFIRISTSLRPDGEAHSSEAISSTSHFTSKSDENISSRDGSARENPDGYSLQAPNVSAKENPYGYDLQASDDLYAWVKEATRIYSPDSWHLLMQYERLPDVSEARHIRNTILSMSRPAGTFHFLEGDNKTEMISSMSTNIHEISHGYYSKNVFRHATEYNILLNTDNVTGFINLSPNESYYIQFPRKSLFPSREIAARIPRSLRSFRFNTYITGNNSTQPEGIFGLLNELHAYYLGSKFDFEILEGYKIAEGCAAKGFYQWVRHSQSSMTALFEFDFFILEYLLYMKSNYPQNYSSLMSYQPFHDAYAAVRMKYHDLVLKYFDKIQEEIQVNNSSSAAVFTTEGNTLWIQKSENGGQTGTSFISNDMNTLLPVLKSNRYSEVEKDFLRCFPRKKCLQ